MIKEQKNSYRKCDHPNCECEGEYRAPKDRSLKDYYWFCLKHVTEYNKSWNYYAGMSDEEIARETKLDETWHSPSWKFGINIDKLAKEGQLDDPFDIYNTYMKRGAQKTQQGNMAFQPALTVKELEAIQILEIKFPYTESQLKTKYKMLVKKYHPDLNNGSKQSEEMFKKVVESYKILLKKITKK